MSQTKKNKCRYFIYKIKQVKVVQYKDKYINDWNRIWIFLKVEPRNLMEKIRINLKKKGKSRVLRRTGYLNGQRK